MCSHPCAAITPIPPQDSSLLSPRAAPLAGSFSAYLFLLLPMAPSKQPLHPSPRCRGQALD